MDDIPILGRNDESQLLNQVIAQFDAPAYIRRARHVEDVYEELLGKCRRRRQEMLLMVRVQLKELAALLPSWDAARPWLANDDQVAMLAELAASLDIEPAEKPGVTPSERAVRRALGELNESVTHFNRRWQDYLADVDVSHVNAARNGYNRYYLLEKECFVRSMRVARQGFHRLAPVTVDELLGALPLLPIVEMRKGATDETRMKHG